MTGRLEQVPAAQPYRGSAPLPRQALKRHPVLPLTARCRSPGSSRRQATPYRAMHLDLSDEEAAALARELRDIIESDKYPSPCSRRSDMRCHREGDTGDAAR